STRTCTTRTRSQSSRTAKGAVTVSHPSTAIDMSTIVTAAATRATTIDLGRGPRTAPVASSQEKN
ncbi:hypothetical protein FRC10_007319, partial [Ceratobasidium sp. 414]